MLKIYQIQNMILQLKIMLQTMPALILRFKFRMKESPLILLLLIRTMPYTSGYHFKFISKAKDGIQYKDT